MTAFVPLSYQNVGLGGSFRFSCDDSICSFNTFDVPCTVVKRRYCIVNPNVHFLPSTVHSRGVLSGAKSAAFMSDGPGSKENGNFIRRWLKRSAEQSDSLGARLRAYGLSAVISYGIFDLVTYAISFLLALRGYVAAGKVVTRKTLPQLIAIMWGLNNFSRPFRVAGALALAPIIDERVVAPISHFLSDWRKKRGGPEKEETGSNSSDTG